MLVTKECILGKLRDMDPGRLRQMTDAIVQLCMNRACAHGESIFDGEKMVHWSHFLTNESRIDVEEPRFLTASVVRLQRGILPHRDPLILNGALMNKGPAVFIDDITPEIEASLKKVHYWVGSLLLLAGVDQVQLPSVFALPENREELCFRFLPDRTDLQEIEARLFPA